MLKTNNLIGISAIILALSVAYYFVLFLPARDKTNDEAKNQADLQKQVENCREVGMKYHNEQTAKNPRLTFHNPEFKYNQQLNTCLYSGGFIDGNYLTNYIIDLNTNKQLATFAALDQKPTSTNEMTIEEYRAKESELFR